MESIRSAVERAAEYLASHPEAGSGPDTTAVATLQDGLRCHVQGPSGEVFTDMGTNLGGGGSAPTPGWLLRAALASCDATVLALEAAREGIELTELSVTVESRSDARGVLGVGDGTPPGPQEVTVRVRLAARNATDEQLRELVGLLETRSAVGDALSRAVEVRTELSPAGT